MSEPIVRFRSVSKTYDGVTEAVRGLDLDILPGEFLTLLGPSGSGKTTTLMMLAGFEPPSAGRILIEGRDMASVPPHRRDLGVVFQHFALFPHMSVAENVAFPLSVRGVPRALRARQVAEALSMVRLDGLGARRPAALSGGQQQRVALARALVFRPAIVLMDEPLGALDRQLREEMQSEIRALHDRLGITVIYVTHDQAEALTMSDRIAVFDHGRLLQLATPPVLYEEPGNAFVARFIGENNFLPVEVLGLAEGMARVRLQGGRELEAIPGESVRAGQPGWLAIRPERIAIAPVRAEDLSPAALPGRISETVYLGDSVRVRVTLADNVSAVVKRPIAAATAALAPGAEVAVAWEPEHARL
ncbi:MAG: ABC transporter ATP-binding protein, partial [Acetobacteraceae bacterium]|nr:ABC transporter ATP-binding protein [Acetobacteraceae bacterium]